MSQVSSSAELLKVLVFSQDENAHDLLESVLLKFLPDDVSIETSSRFEDLKTLGRHTSYDALFLSYKDNYNESEISLLSDIIRQSTQAKIFALIDKDSVSLRMKALDLGAHDYLTYPFDYEACSAKFVDLLELSTKKKMSVPHSAESYYHFEGFIGTSQIMRNVYRQIDQISGSNAPVFITGESGTGKEVCAEAIKNRSNRNHKPFIALNCGAIPGELMESEIFGHVKGAFTGAYCDRIGAAAQAHQGTLFLDEICEMPITLQTKLLRFLQTGAINRVGSAEVENVDVRIICATNKNPLKEVTSGRFREDLYYRLHVLPLHLPALKERSEDILDMANAFLSMFSHQENKSFTGFDYASEAALKSYDWPGNIRQLQNTIRRIVVIYDQAIVTNEMIDLPLMAQNENVKPDHIFQMSTNSKMHPFLDSFGEIAPLWQYEREIIEAVLDLFQGNISKAAASLEISPSTIYRKKQQWEENIAKQIIA